MGVEIAEQGRVLFDAAHWEDVERYEALVGEHASEIEATDGELQWTALHAAAAQGRADIVQVLLRNGANIEAVDTLRRTPLMTAARTGHANALVELAQHGAKLQTSDRLGNQALHLAVMFGRTDAVAKLLELGVDANASRKAKSVVGRSNLFAMMLMTSLASGEAPDGEVIEKFGALSIDADETKLTIDMPTTPLLLAAKLNFPAIGTLLLQHGATTDAADAEGKTALHLAAEHDTLELVQALLDVGADVHVTDKRGNTATSYGGDDTRKTLLVAQEGGPIDWEVYDRTGNAYLCSLVERAQEMLGIKPTDEDDRVKCHEMAIDFLSSSEIIYEIVKLSNGVEPREDMEPAEKEAAEEAFVAAAAVIIVRATGGDDFEVSDDDWSGGSDDEYDDEDD